MDIGKEIEEIEFDSPFEQPAAPVEPAVAPAVPDRELEPAQRHMARLQSLKAAQARFASFPTHKKKELLEGLREADEAAERILAGRPVAR